ncbi:flagellar hook basal-body protein [Candidatus Saganbacteria bacterium]|nr:flagellar hook basal-body protein [Candidatus Saganbacteria bacterium]
MSDSILEIGNSGLETTDEKVKSLINRMVNADTPGFKSSDVTVRSFPMELDAAEKKIKTQKPQVDGTFYNFDQGSLIRTGKNTDLSIAGSGFFVVLGEWGEGYTRDGRFTVNSEGRLVTTTGNLPLLGQNGPISIPLNSGIVVLENGEIRADKVTIDKIRVVDFEDKASLSSINGIIFKQSSNLQPVKEVETPKILQGFIESSNAKAVDQMVELISLSHLYNLNTKVISTRDASMSRAIEMGKSQ